ncbi:MAG: M48 family metalloprotease [Rhodoferax sp.]|nr:M48 family metalloprotease [Rhodoferax sp.]
MTDLFAFPRWRLGCMGARSVGARVALPLLLFAQLTASWAQSPASVAPAAPATQLPTLGSGGEMNSSAERRLGERIAREIYRDPDYIDDPLLVDYVQGIWQPLLRAARARGDLSEELDQRFAWEVMLGRDRSINAFALPGGYLGLHLGLVGAVSSRDELASVLAHELSHVTQRHISRIMTKQSQQAPWLLGAMILGALAASKSPDAANAVLVGSQAVAAQTQLNFSRDMEREADRVGYGILVQAGFDPQGFVSMFDKLGQSARLNDSGAFPYLRSHPLTTERLADMQSRQSPGARAPDVAQQASSHAMLSARARVLSNSSVDALRGWLAQVPKSVGDQSPLSAQAAALYGGALAASKLRDPVIATSYAQHLGRLPITEPAALRLVALLHAELSLAHGDAGKALAVLAAVAPSRPDPVGGPSQVDRPWLMLSAQAWVAAGQPALATERLQEWVVLHPRDAQAWSLLSTAYAAQGNTLRSVRANAEAKVAVLDYDAALDRFNAAQALLRESGARASGADHIEASIIDTRRREVQSLLKEQALER